MTNGSAHPGNGLVSVITAVRNGEQAIGATLESVACQTYPNVEHVIIDGASRDGTLDVVRRHGSRLGAVVSEPDTGVYDAFNKGLRHARGEWITYMGAGDRYASDAAIARLVDAARHSHSDIVFSDLAIVAPGTDRVERLFRSAGFSGARIRDGYMPAHPTLLVSRALYQEFGEYDTSYRIAGDFEYIARLFARRPMRYNYVPEVLVHMEGGGLSNQGWKSKWRITREMHRACRQHGISSSWARLLMRLPMKYLSEVMRRGKPA